MFNETPASSMDQKPSDESQTEQGAPKVKRIHPVISKIKNKETGIGERSWTEVKGKHPNNALKQVASFFDDFQIPAAIGRKRKASIKTHEDYRDGNPPKKHWAEK